MTNSLTWQDIWIQYVLVSLIQGYIRQNYTIPAASKCLDALGPPTQAGNNIAPSEDAPPALAVKNPSRSEDACNAPDMGPSSAEQCNPPSVSTNSNNVLLASSLSNNMLEIEGQSDPKPSSKAKRSQQQPSRNRTTSEATRGTLDSVHGKTQLYASACKAIIMRHLLDCGNCCTSEAVCVQTDASGYSEQCKTCIIQKKSRPTCKHHDWLKPQRVKTWAEQIQQGMSEAKADCIVFGRLDVLGQPQHNRITNYSLVNPKI